MALLHFKVRCFTMSELRKRVATCPFNCNGNGWCNNKGHCHCKMGFAPPDCSEPGFGGSLISGPSTNPYGELLLLVKCYYLKSVCVLGLIMIRNIIFIIFLGIILPLGLVWITSYLIVAKYGKCLQFWKMVIDRKTPVPTISNSLYMQTQIPNNENFNFPHLHKPEVEFCIENTHYNQLEYNSKQQDVSFGIENNRQRIQSQFIKPQVNLKASLLQDTKNEHIYANSAIYENVNEMRDVQNLDIYAQPKKHKHKNYNKSLSTNSTNHETQNLSSIHKYARKKQTLGMFPSTLNQQKDLEDRSMQMVVPKTQTFVKPPPSLGRKGEIKPEQKMAMTVDTQKINLRKVEQKSVPERSSSSGRISIDFKQISVKDMIKKINRNK